MALLKNSDLDSILSKLKASRNPKNIEGMVKFGISSAGTLGVPVPIIRKMAKEIGKNHSLAIELWDSKIHEARILAGIIADPKLTDSKMMDKWVQDFDSWDICDQACMNLFDKTEYAYTKAHEWADCDKEFVRRAGFALMAALSVHDKKADDSKFESFFPLIEKYAYDNRNFVRKAVNWALRQIGKRNKSLHGKALILSKKISQQETKSAKWIAKDAIRELEGPIVKRKLKL